MDFAIPCPAARQKLYVLPDAPNSISSELMKAIRSYEAFVREDAANQMHPEWKDAAQAIAEYPAASAEEQALKLLYVTHYIAPRYDYDTSRLVIGLHEIDCDAGHMLIGIAQDLLRTSNMGGC